MRGKLQLNIYEVVEQVGISNNSYNSAVIENLKIYQFAPEFVPWLLMDEEKHVEISHVCLDQSDEDISTLKNIIGDDEMQMYGYNVHRQIKAQPSPGSGKIIIKSLNMKLMLIIFFIGMVLLYAPHSHTTIKNYTWK